MAAKNRSGKRRLAAGEDPATAVPEADAVEQSVPAADEENDHWLDEPTGESLDQAAEGDVVEQRRDVGTDDDEHR